MLGPALTSLSMFANQVRVVRAIAAKQLPSSSHPDARRATRTRASEALNSMAYRLTRGR